MRIFQACMLALLTACAFSLGAAEPVTIQQIVTAPDGKGIRLEVEADGALAGKVEVLTEPDRLLVKFANARLASKKMSREIGVGELQRARIAEHTDGSVWMVIDLAKPIQFNALGEQEKGFALWLEADATTRLKPKATATPKLKPSKEPTLAPTAAATSTHEPTPVAMATPTTKPTTVPTPEPTAEPSPQPTEIPIGKPKAPGQIPKISLIFFDLNVLFQGKQYDRFPCANFIYDKGDTFPLKREFVSTMVFYRGSGLFVGTLRILGPKGELLERTREPFAFNLVSDVSDYSVEIPWKIEFPSRGNYTMILTLNGQDALETKFYVGYLDDKADKK
ncbi:MAG: AMIN domain-containing protein [candidate division FCPU426 bacterium]